MLHLILWELRRLFNKRNCVAIVVTAILLFLYLIVSIIINNPMFKQDGSAYYGFHAIHEKMKVNQSVHEVLKDNDFKKSYEVMHDVFDNPKNFDANGNMNNDVYAKAYSPYESIANLMIRIYSPPGTFDPDNVLKMKEKDVHLSDFYTKRTQNIKDLLKFSRYSPEERSFLLDKANAMYMKHLVLDNAQGMTQILHNFQIVQLAIVFICMIVLSPIFSRDRQLHFDVIVGSSKYGKSKAFYAKIIAGFVAAFLLYFIFIGISLFIQLGLFGKMNMISPIQIESSFWLSIFPFTFYSASGWAILLGLCATLCTCAITIVISLFSKKDYTCLLLSFAVFIIPKIMFDMHIFEPLFRIFPIHMLDINGYISSYDNIVYSLFGHPVMVTNLSVIFSLCMALFILVFGIGTYKCFKHKRLTSH